MLSRRLGAMFTFALTMIALLSGLVQAQTPLREVAEPDTSTVSFRSQVLPGSGLSDVTAVAQRTVLRSFLLKHPNYHIEPFSMPTAGGNAMDTGPLMAIAAGVPAHVMYVNFRFSSTYVAQGFLEPMEILLARILSTNPAVREPVDDKTWKEDPTAHEIAHALELIRQRTPKPAWPVVYRQPESEGKQKHAWAVPMSSVVMALLYRRDLFNQAGLDPDRAPQTWDELLEYSRMLTVPERKQYGMAISPGQTISWSIYTFLVSNGARAVQQDEHGQWRATYNGQGAAEAIHFFYRLAKEPFERNGQTIDGSVRFADRDIELLWDRGQVAMRFNYLNEELLAGINPQLVGIAPVPIAYNGQRGSEINCGMLGIFTGSTPQQKLAAMRYVWYVTSDEAQRIRTQVYIENGFGMFVSPILLKKFGHDRILRQVPPQWQEAFNVAMEAGVPEPYGRNTGGIYRFMSVPINQALELKLNGLPKEAAQAQIQQVLDASVNEVNVKVLSNVPPEEMKQRRIVASVVIVIIAIVFTMGMYHVWTYFTRVSAPVSGKRNWRRFIWGYVLLLPGFGLVMMWQYIPLLIGGLSMSFMDYQLVQESKFVGVDNFANVLYDDKFWMALWRTFYFVALTIGLGFWPPILLAILLQEVPTNTAKYLFRTIYYLPAVISGVVIMFLWKQLYDPSKDGVLNQLLLSLNMLGAIPATFVKLVFLGLLLSLIAMLFWLPIKIEEMGRGLRIGMWCFGGALLLALLMPVVQATRLEGFAGLTAMLTSAVGPFAIKPLRWIDDPGLAMICVVIPTVWAGTGPGCILYLAALKSIPDDLYEAADIDGASHWHKIFYIVLPALKYLLGIQFVAAVIGSFKGGTDFILALTGGGPNNATNILALEIFLRTFTDLQFGIGTAMAWILGALLIGFTAYQLKTLSNAEFKTSGK